MKCITLSRWLVKSHWRILIWPRALHPELGGPRVGFRSCLKRFESLPFAATAFFILERLRSYQFLLLSRSRRAGDSTAEMRSFRWLLLLASGFAGATEPEDVRWTSPQSGETFEPGQMITASWCVIYSWRRQDAPRFTDHYLLSRLKAKRPSDNFALLLSMRRSRRRR